MLKRLVKQRKYYLPLARKSLKTRRILGENRRLEIFSKNRRFSAKTGGLESPQFILRTSVLTLHKLQQQHSERLSLRSSETKSHRHLNIKVFAFLNSCPKLINVLIWITIKWIPQIPVNTCVLSNYVRNVLRSPCENDCCHLGLEQIP